MFVVGLTGGIGSGKTTVANLFEKKNILVIDTDQIAREVTRPEQPALAAIIGKFGERILLSNNTLDRAELRKIVFSDNKKRIWLEQLLHPLILNELHKQIEPAVSPYVIAIIPLLLETKPNPLIKRILVVDATEEQQLQRAHIRDKLSINDIENILKTQVTRAERLAAADDIIYNFGNLEELATQVEKLHQFYFSLSGI